MSNNLNVISDMKQTMLRALLSDEDVVKILRNTCDVELPDMGLRYTQVFPWMYVPDTVEETKSYIGMKIKARNQINAAAKVYEMTIYIICHKEHMRMNAAVCEQLGLDTTDSGSRVDVLMDKVDCLINGSEEFGFGKVEFVESDEFRPTDKFHGRYITYRVNGWNRWGEKL